MRPFLRLAGITKRFGALVANDAIDLELAAGEILGLLGENGAGKSTLMSVLFGHYAADQGEVLVAGDGGTLRPLPPGSPRAALAAGIGMVHQHFTLADNRSAFDNIVLGTVPWWRPRRRSGAARARIAELAGRSGLAVPLDEPAGSLSVGERQRVEILKALYRDAQVLILDEPTAVLTPPETEALFGTLRQLAAGGVGIILISHKLGEVMGLCGRVAVLRRGRKVLEAATASLAEAELAEALIGRTVAARRREAVAPGPPVLELERVSAPGRVGLRQASLQVRAAEIVGIAGVAGNGQEALTAVVAGLVAPSAGVIRLRGERWPGASPRRLKRAGVGRVPEDRHRHGLVGDLGVADNLVLESYRSRRFQAAGLRRTEAVTAHAVEAIRAFGVATSGPAQPARLLSGGNAQKLVLARALDGDPVLILADQPCRGLDVGAVAEVHGRLLAARRRGAGVLLLSEDLDELLSLADRIAVLHRGELGPALPAGSLSPRDLGLMMAGRSPLAA